MTLKRKLSLTLKNKLRNIIHNNNLLPLCDNKPFNTLDFYSALDYFKNLFKPSNKNNNNNNNKNINIKFIILFILSAVIDVLITILTLHYFSLNIFELFTSFDF